MHHLLIVLFITLTSLSAHGAVQIFESGRDRVKLIELYTSQGCSSCPPAERWLSGLLNDKLLWSKIVPINFHVDYWDKLGWPDKYASPKYTQRQYIYKARGNTKIVATPGFIVNGAGWNGWFTGRSLPIVNENNIGQLLLKIEKNQVDIKFVAVKKTIGPIKLNISKLGFGLFDDIKRGENKGKILRHDFVALTLQQQTLVSNGKENEYLGSITLTQENLSTSLKGIAAWITIDNNQTPVQAVGGFLK